MKVREKAKDVGTFPVAKRPAGGNNETGNAAVGSTWRGGAEGLFGLERKTRWNDEIQGPLIDTGPEPQSAA